MTVLPFKSPRHHGRPPAAPATVDVTGTFDAPQGGRGVFIGSYRLERLRVENNHLMAAAVLTGQLLAPDGSPVAVGSRRHTASAELVSDDAQHLVCVGRLEVNIAGFLVSTGEVTVPIAREMSPPAR